MIPQVVFYLFIFVVNCDGYQNAWNPNRRPQKIPQDVMVDVVNNLALKLLAVHNEGNDNNIAISPYGTLSVLVALKEGVRGDAAYEIQQATNIPSDLSVVRVGLRDIHRHLKSYFIPDEGFLSGLTLSHDNVTLNRDYEDILRFYGFDINSFNNAVFGDLFTTVPTTTDATTTEIVTTTTQNDRITREESTETTPSTTVQVFTSNIVTTTEMPSSVTTTSVSQEAATTTKVSTPSTEQNIVTTEILTTSAVPEIVTTTEVTKPSTRRNVVTTASSAIPQEDITTTEVTVASTKRDVVTIASDAPQEDVTTTEVTKTSTRRNAVTTATSDAPQEDVTATKLTVESTEQNFVTTTEIPATSDVPEVVTTTKVARPLTESSIVATTEAQNTVTEVKLNDQTESMTEDDLVELIDVTTTEEEEIENSSEASTTNEIIDETTENTSETVSRNRRSVVDYIIARYYDDHTITQRPPPYNSENNLYFLINGMYKESNINYMTYDTVLPFHYIPHLNTLALRFPLDSARYYLLLLLPENPQNINKLICDLRLNGNLKYIIDNLRYTHVKAIIPSFMLKGYVVLTPTLQKMGIRQVFEPRRADFSQMTSDPNIYVTNIEQAITVNIRNYVDPVTMNNNRYMHRNNPVLFRADHPFLYFVIDSEIDVTLMMGKIINPLNSRIR